MPYGYIHDQEIGLYYLQSRYYNPEWGRFISMDSLDVLTASPMSLTDKNLFAYCDNNPINRVDPSGDFWVLAFVGALVNVTTTYIAAKVTGQEYTWTDAAVAAASGAANAIPGVGPLISGAISGGYAGYMSYKNGATLGESMFSGTVAGLCTTASISNLANVQGPTLDLLTSAVTDLVFGTGYNSIAAATYKAVTDNARKREINDSNSESASNYKGSRSFFAGGKSRLAIYYIGLR